MYNHIMYLSYWIINSLVLYVANLFLPQNVMLGDWRFNTVESSIYAGFWLTFLVWIFWDFAIARKFSPKKGFAFFFFFFLVNSISLWIVSLFPNYTGFSFYNDQWALIIGFVLAILQQISWKLVKNKG